MYVVRYVAYPSLHLLLARVAPIAVFVSNKYHITTRRGSLDLFLLITIHITATSKRLVAELNFRFDKEQRKGSRLKKWIYRNVTSPNSTSNLNPIIRPSLLTVKLFRAPRRDPAPISCTITIQSSPPKRLTAFEMM